tara:strand:+ start:1251 stop:1529 length:279 start_codon:yes stop_codon:yes gene_type:complete
MGKLTASEVEKLEKSGVLTKKTVNELQEEGLASSKRRNTTKRYMKTEDGKWVSPTLYWRGAKDTQPSKHMNEFNEEFKTLLEKYATTETETK